MPKTNCDYWQRKIAGNKDRDVAHVFRLRRSGWKVLVVWECELQDEPALSGRLTKLLSEQERMPKTSQTLPKIGWKKFRNRDSYELLTAHHEAQVWFANPVWVCSCKGSVVNISIDYDRRLESAREAKKFVEDQLKATGEV